MTLDKYSVVEGGLYYKDRLCVPEDLYIAVIQEVHDQPAYDYLGVARIYELVKREYYQRGMKSTIKRYIRNYYIYQRIKAPRHRENRLLQLLLIPQKRQQDISIDFITSLPLLDIYNAIYIFVDRLTKERHYIPYTSDEYGTSIENIVDILIKEVFRLYDLPVSIISDRGLQFIVNLWSSFYKRLGIKAKMSTAFYSKTDGQTKRTN